MSLNFNQGGNRRRYKFRDYLKAEKIGWIVTLVAGIALVAVFTIASYLMSSDGDVKDPVKLSDSNLSTAPEPQDIPEPLIPVLDEEDSSSVSKADLPAEVEQAPEPEEEEIVVAAAPETWLPPALGAWEKVYGFGLDATHNDYRMHTGLDMPLPIGELVFAVAGGTVSKAASDDRWGGRVEITHGGGYTSVYLGITPSVKEGDIVQGGDSIATVAPSPPTEQAQESHLHLELWQNEELVDAGAYFNPEQ